MKFIIAGPKGKVIKLDTERFIERFMKNPLGAAIDVVDIVRDTPVKKATGQSK